MKSKRIMRLVALSVVLFALLSSGCDSDGSNAANGSDAHGVWFIAALIEYYIAVDESTFVQYAYDETNSCYLVIAQTIEKHVGDVLHLLGRIEYVSPDGSLVSDEYRTRVTVRLISNGSHAVFETHGGPTYAGRKVKKGVEGFSPACAGR